jgi:DNA modification methylase
VIWEVRQGDTLEQLRLMPDGCVQTCVTSPPYFGLRDYGTGEWEGGDEGCDHVEKFNRNDGNRQGANGFAGNANREGHADMGTRRFRDVCGKCGARRIDQQVGLESTPDEYVNRLVEVFREVRRVLRDDGTLWLNLGDSYANAPRGNTDATVASSNLAGGGGYQHDMARGGVDKSRLPGVKQKDLLGIPWMVAFALRADGWYLRSDIIWAKPNPMPESVTDRPTKAHEYVFLLSKGPRYFYDADAIREEHTRLWDGSNGGSLGATDWNADAQACGGGRQDGKGTASLPNPAGRNKRSVWTVATQPFPGAHFAVFPPKLIEPCVLAGSAETACGVCGAPWERVVERGPSSWEARKDAGHLASGYHADDGAVASFPNPDLADAPEGAVTGGLGWVAPTKTVGWQPTCTHHDDTGTSTVLDPFCGAGTTGLVATRNNRSFIGIELNPDYAEMARQRIRDDQPLMNYLTETAA